MMIVNGKKYEIADLIKNLDFKSNMLQKAGDILLTGREIDILNKNYIDYKTCKNLKDLMMKIEYVLDDEELDSDDADELEYVLEVISERDYYENTRK